jgi:PAS domain S-box-containing protein
MMGRMDMSMTSKTKGLEAYVDDILDVLSDGIYISDCEGRTLKVNKMYEQLTGLNEKELSGRLVTDLQKNGVFDVVLNPEIVKTGQAKTTVQVTKVGRTVVLNGYPVMDDQGKVVLVVTFVRDVTVLYQIKEQLAQQQELIERYQSQVQFVPKDGTASSLVYRSKEMQTLLNSLQIIAKTDATTLLLGETGSGKGVIARKLHELSTRNTKPFFKIDCTTIPENLFESELFGFEAGAFSGANAKGKPGLVEMAHGGTLFLDEIGELPLALQGKLLRVLQDQEVMRLGSTKVRKVDVRFIAATNRDLEDGVRRGTFRSDLYYRLRVAVLHIPALRERSQDILPLADCFLERFNAKYKKRMILSEEVRRTLENYEWPGNIREMENFIQSLIVTRDKDLIEITDLPANMLNVMAIGDDRSLNDILCDIERELLKKALNIHGSIAVVAKHLKVDRVTIYRKLKKYSLM